MQKLTTNIQSETRFCICYLCWHDENFFVHTGFCSGLLYSYTHTDIQWCIIQVQVFSALLWCYASTTQLCMAKKKKHVSHWQCKATSKHQTNKWPQTLQWQVHMQLYNKTSWKKRSLKWPINCSLFCRDWVRTLVLQDSCL